ncbi:5'-nucleotidase SurE [Candidatus Zixiibacteriota bacterium]|nr:5'-nucleotidase SurE [candidate division Zixibacteria bacterium]
MLILITNDDGIHADGLLSLEKELKKTAEVLVVAPEMEQSASSHSFTLSRPLRIHQRGTNRYVCDGTPTDCVMLAVHGILKHKLPDLLLSGINHGSNMGEDVTYSGTVAAAIEGSILGIPSVALSNSDSENLKAFGAAARFTARFVKHIKKFGLSTDTFLNINFPLLKGNRYGKFSFTSLGKRTYRDIIIEKTDPRGKNYYWIAGKSTWSNIEGSDFLAVSRGYVSISPLQMNFTDFEAIPKMSKIRLKI